MNRARDFFIESSEGEKFMAELQRLINDNHEKGENDPEHARDHAQRAKGIRQVTSYIQTITAESGKKRERLIEEANRLNLK